MNVEGLKPNQPSESNWKRFRVWAGLIVLVPPALLAGRHFLKGDPIPELSVSAESGPFQVPQQAKDSSLEKMIYFAKIKVANDGYYTAEDVAITWNGNGFAHIVDAEGKIQERTFSKSLSLGELPPDRVLNISLWTKEEFSANSEVIPKVSCNGDKKPIFERAGVPLYQFLIMLLVFTVVMIDYWYKARKANKAEALLKSTTDIMFKQINSQDSELNAANRKISELTLQLEDANELRKAMQAMQEFREPS